MTGGCSSCFMSTSLARIREAHIGRGTGRGDGPRPTFVIAASTFGDVGRPRRRLRWGHVRLQRVMLGPANRRDRFVDVACCLAAAGLGALFLSPALRDAATPLPTAAGLLALFSLAVHRPLRPVLVALALWVPCVVVFAAYS